MREKCEEREGGRERQKSGEGSQRKREQQVSFLSFVEGFLDPLPPSCSVDLSRLVPEPAKNSGHLVTRCGTVSL